MTRSRLVWPSADRIPGILLAVSAGLGLVLVVEVINQVVTLGTLSTVSASDLPWPYIVSFLLSVPFILGIGYGARYLADEPLPPVRNHRILTWCLGGMAIWLVINLLTMLSFGYIAFWPTVGWVRGALAWGGAFGLLVGIIEARAITSAVETEQAQLRAEYLAEQQDTVDYLNSLLRHEVLNSTVVIRGHAEILEEELESPVVSEHVEPILRRSTDITEFIKHSRQMMESLYEEPDFERLQLSELLHEEVEIVQELEPDAELSVDTPADLSVEGDAMLGRIFGNLLANAIEHNDSEPPRVAVTATTTDEEIRIDIEDNGPGIDPETRATLFERPDQTGSDHGFGLYIVSRLCERYGGTISLVETGPQGTTFRVTLPRVDSDREQETETAADSTLHA